jgi:probable phosphoglycerate mutase
MNKKIYLIRHGKIDTGNEKRYVGITDLLLNNEGVEQANFLKSYFSHIPIDKVYTSPLKRCLQTSKIICEEKNQDYIIVEELREINMGIWENKPIEHIKKDFPQLYEERGKNLEYFIPPEGESFHQLANRVLLAFDNIVKNKCESNELSHLPIGAGENGTHRGNYENIIIVAHAGVNRVILSQILGYSMQDIFSIEQPYGCVNELIL